LGTEKPSAFELNDPQLSALLHPHHGLSCYLIEMCHAIQQAQEAQAISTGRQTRHIERERALQTTIQTPVQRFLHRPSLCETVTVSEWLAAVSHRL